MLATPTEYRMAAAELRRRADVALAAFGYGDPLTLLAPARLAAAESLERQADALERNTEEA